MLGKARLGTGSLAIAAVWLAAQPVGAVILFGLDNSANQTDPGSGAPWGSVALVSDAAGANPSGTAIHLGGGYMLTANHVGMKTHVTFDGVSYVTRDAGYVPVQVAFGVDMKVFKLSSTPTVAAVELYGGGGADLGDSTQIGWGLGRDVTVPVDSAVVNWGDETTIAKRWGFNTPLETDTFGYSGGSYEGLITYLGSETGSPSGLGESEAAATLYDSGSGLFRNIGGTWYLTGLTTSVETFGVSTFGDDAVSGAGRGEANYFVRVGTYRDDVLAVIPEPSAYFLIALGLVLPMARRRVSHH